MIKSFKSTICEERLRGTGLFSLEKRLLKYGNSLQIRERSLQRGRGWAFACIILLAFEPSPAKSLDLWFILLLVLLWSYCYCCQFLSQWSNYFFCWLKLKYHLHTVAFWVSECGNLSLVLGSAAEGRVCYRTWLIFPFHLFLLFLCFGNQLVLAAIEVFISWSVAH